MSEQGGNPKTEGNPSADDPVTLGPELVTPVEETESGNGASGGGDGAGDGAGPSNPEDDALDAKRMTLLEHLGELRVRLRNAAVVFVVALLVSFFFVQRFFVILTKPACRGLADAGKICTFNYTNFTEPFWVWMKLAIVAGFIIAGPFIFWELWKFVAPGLYKKEKRLAGLVTGATAGCFAGGALFAYFVLARPAAYYMVKLAEAPGVEINPMLKMEEVGNFLILMFAGCGAAFELPVVLAILGSIGLVSARGLLKFNKYALVLSVVAGGVLTPSTDPFTQMLLAGPLFALYEISILIVWSIDRGRKKKEDELEKQYQKDDDDSKSA